MTGSPEEIWLAATWPFVRDHLPRPPAAVAELGCGSAGGHVPALLRAGYHATGVDPGAPRGPDYRQIGFEDYRPDNLLDAVVASVSLHHVRDPGAVLDLVSEVLVPDGVLVVVEWVSEDFDEATANWCFRHRLRDPAEPGAWLADLYGQWTASGMSWDAFFQEWLQEDGLHPAAAIRRALAARFVTTHESRGPYYFPDLLDTGPGAEQATIDAGQIKAGCLRYSGRRKRPPPEPDSNDRQRADRSYPRTSRGTLRRPVPARISPVPAPEANAPTAEKKTTRVKSQQRPDQLRRRTISFSVSWHTR